MHDEPSIDGDSARASMLGCWSRQTFVIRVLSFALCPRNGIVQAISALSILGVVVLALLWMPQAGAAEPPIVATAFTPDGKTVIIGSQRGIERRSWPDLAPLDALPCEMSHVHDVAISPSGDRLAAVGGSPAESGSLQLFRWPEGTSLGVYQLAGDVFYQVAWREDGRQIALAGSDGRVLLVDGKGQVAHELVGHSRGVLGVSYLESTLR